MSDDKLSPDEQDINILKKYYDFAKTNFKLSDEAALQLFYEALLFFKLKNVDAGDPLQDSNKFGGEFS